MYLPPGCNVCYDSCTIGGEKKTRSIARSTLEWLLAVGVLFPIRALSLVTHDILGKPQAQQITSMVKARVRTVYVRHGDGSPRTVKKASGDVFRSCSPVETS